MQPSTNIIAHPHGVKDKIHRISSIEVAKHWTNTNTPIRSVQPRTEGSFLGLRIKDTRVKVSTAEHLVATDLVIEAVSQTPAAPDSKCLPGCFLLEAPESLLPCPVLLSEVPSFLVS